MTPAAIKSILENNVVLFAARIFLTLPFWGSGFGKLADFQGAVAEFAHFNIEPAVPLVVLTIIVQLGGSALVILNRWSWLGAGALGVFTALTIPLVHHFWDMEGEGALHAFYTATEHIGMIGGLMISAILSVRQKA